MNEQKQEETMAAKLVEKLRIIVFPILGVVLILCSGHVTRILPYLLGGAMALTAVLRGINDYKTRKAWLPIAAATRFLSIFAAYLWARQLS